VHYDGEEEWNNETELKRILELLIIKTDELKERESFR
jgi:hypothetical protein